MRLTLKKKIVIGLAAILLIGLGSMLAIYRGLSAVKQHMHELADIREPASAAAYEMEINVNGMGLAVLKYLDDRNPKYREWVEDGNAGFERFHTRYRELSESKEEIDLADDLDARFRKFKSLGTSLMKAQEAGDTVIARIDRHMENIDRILEGQLQPKSERVPSACAKLEAGSQMETDIAKLGRWLANYRGSQEQRHRERLVNQQARFQQAVAAYEDLHLNSKEAHWTAELKDEFSQTVIELDRLLALEESLQTKTDRFIGFRSEIDRLLDDKIQILALRNLYVPRQAANDATQGVLQTTRFLIPLFVFSGWGIAALFIRTVTGPLLELRRGTEAIGRGDLRHRIVATGRDEYADLARQFNRMVVQLQITTVSKELLEVSEEKLHETVADLRREIHERERAEQERTELQAALRRSETMSAMGALVAGVSHEVRNPLFAISSMLDAMDARFAGREEYQRYTSLLHQEVNRMNKLMADLLQYGKPTPVELLPGPIGDVLGQAVHACSGLAPRTPVEISTSAQWDNAWILRDKTRLVQVFQNLLENAVQHSLPGTAVIIDVQQVYEGEQAWVACIVKDSGPGFSEESLSRIFEPFFTRRRGGTGLGLSIVQRIVEQHGGRISASNRPEGGAAMEVRLPQVEAPKAFR